MTHKSLCARSAIMRCEPRNCVVKMNCPPSFPIGTSGWLFARDGSFGRSGKRLPPELCQRYPAVPWKLLAGMRDRVSHGYDGIDYAILWDTVRDDIPGLLATVENMLQDLDPSQHQ